MMRGVQAGFLGQAAQRHVHRRLEQRIDDATLAGIDCDLDRTHMFFLKGKCGE